MRGNRMERVVALVLATLSFFGLATAQKVTTVLGDAWTGEVVSTDEGKREIIIRFESKGKTETFTGVLVEGYKVKMKDGSTVELKVSEIPVGTRIRVFAKTREQDVGGRKAKVNLISRIDFLGKDDFARLREQLNVQPSTSVTLAESKDLPAGNPLKIYMAVEDPKVSESLIEWIGKWNKDNGAKYGTLEVVSNMAKADVYLARYRGSKLIVEIMPTATIFLVVPKNDRLEVIWRQAVAIDPEQGSSPIIEKEFEKRMKARRK
jgi:hypothetical protein